MQKSVTFKKAGISFSDVGKGTAVVLLHGFLENTSMWKDVIPQLSKRNRVIAIDLLGLGNKVACRF
jgi:pimeloyl-ACP methyl ester carboxylesterase